MDWFSLFMQFGPAIIQAIPAIRDVFASSTTGTTQKLTEVVQTVAPALVPVLEAAGAKQFPALASVLHVGAVALVSFHPNFTQWVQDALNRLMTPDAINAAIQTVSPGSKDNALGVDGHYGPKTTAVLKAYQKSQGLAVTGFADDAEQAIITYALSKLGV